MTPKSGEENADTVSDARTEFRIIFEGLELPLDVRTRIDQALQAAVLIELARLDLGGYSVARLSQSRADQIAGGGGTQGIAISGA